MFTPSIEVLADRIIIHLAPQPTNERASSAWHPKRSPAPVRTAPGPMLPPLSPEEETELARLADGILANVGGSETLGLIELRDAIPSAFSNRQGSTDSYTNFQAFLARHNFTFPSAL